MEHLIRRIQSTNYIYFTEDELDLTRRGHNKSLYITVKCKDGVVAKVLVDNGLALNVLLKHVMDQIPIEISHIKPNTMTVRAYNGTLKPMEVLKWICISDHNCSW
jgi:hypothetical protein